MYNIHSHYESIFQYLKRIVSHRRLLYLLPYGSTQPENIETITDDLYKLNWEIRKNTPREIGIPRPLPLPDGPMFICYDQEPLYGNYNYKLLDYINANYLAPFILVTTEKNSTPLNNLKERYNWSSVYYFHHAFAASDWYRGYQYHADLISPINRKIKKKYITFNRITGNARSYRSFLVAELAKHNLLDKGHVSYSEICPEHGHYEHNILTTVNDYGIPFDYATNCIQLLDQIKHPLRIDSNEDIPNGSQSLSAVPQCMESFLHIVTETCYWETKCHLTEKIFKPIVSRMPFVLLGCANNLAYLKEYGFKTFDAWWDESYDTIEDPIKRLQAVVKIIKDISNLSNEELENMLVSMQSVLDHNYNLFYSNTFLDQCWNELTTNLESAVAQLPPPIV